VIPRGQVVAQRLTQMWLRRKLRIVGVSITGRLTIVGAPIVDVYPKSDVSIHDGVTLVSSCWWTALGVSRPVIIRTLSPEAKISIGAGSGLSGTTLCSVVGISLGERVLCGSDVLIADTNFHPIDDFPRVDLPMPACNPSDAIVIEDDVFLGARSIVLKGVTIEAGTVVGAGSVVSGSLPRGVVAAGNPARVIRSLHPGADRL
jgi:acetyltransferase-like isoleucine patch superfamily enzyme